MTIREAIHSNGRLSVRLEHCAGQWRASLYLVGQRIFEGDWRGGPCQAVADLLYHPDPAPVECGQMDWIAETEEASK